MGRPKKISTREMRTMRRALIKKPSSCNQLKQSYKIKASVRTISRTLNKNGIQRRKLKKQTKLTLKHIEQRLNFGQMHMDWKDMWHNVLFSDEKKFNLDGPDGFRYFWHVLGRDYPYYSKRICGGGSVMLWCGFLSDEVILFKFIQGTITAGNYQKLLDEFNLAVLLNYGIKENAKCIFQQDNAPAHSVCFFLTVN